jgi:hypothetical protein
MTSALRWGRVLVVVLWVTNAAPVKAEGFRLGASAGVTSTYNQTYFTLGGRLGYDVGFGVTPELGLTLWTGGTPSIVELSPGITWYMPLPVIRPYVGAFYSYQFVGSGYANQDAVGGRAGIGLFGAGPVSVSIGAAYKKLLSCPANASCETWWPEAFAGVGF